MAVYKKLKKIANNKWVSFGKQLIKARAKEQSSTLAAQERQLKNAFGQRKLTQQVNRLTGKQRGATLRSVTAPSKEDSNIQIECHEKGSIEKAFMGKGTWRFSQTNTTPLM
jgi:hypothetical protein